MDPVTDKKKLPATDIASKSTPLFKMCQQCSMPASKLQYVGEPRRLVPLFVTLPVNRLPLATHVTPFSNQFQTSCSCLINFEKKIVYYFLNREIKDTKLTISTLLILAASSDLYHISSCRVKNGNCFLLLTLHPLFLRGNEKGTTTHAHETKPIMVQGRKREFKYSFSCGV